MFKYSFFVLVLLSTTFPTQAMDVDSEEELVQHILQKPAPTTAEEKAHAKDEIDQVLNKGNPQNGWQAAGLLLAITKYKLNIDELDAPIEWKVKYHLFNAHCYRVLLFDGAKARPDNLDDNKRSSLQRKLEWTRSGIEYCRTALSLNLTGRDDLVRKSKKPLANFLVWFAYLNKNNPLEAYNAAHESGDIYMELELPEGAYGSYLITCNLLENRPRLIKGQQGRFKEIQSKLKELERALKSSKTREEMDLHEKTKRLCEIRVLLKQKLSLKEKTSLYIEKGDLAISISAEEPDNPRHKREALFSYLQATKTAYKKSELYSKVLKCIEGVEGLSPSRESLSLIYKEDIPLLAAVFAFYLLKDDFGAAKLRCDVFCDLERAKTGGDLSKKTSYMRMLVNDLNGDSEEFLNYVSEEKAKRIAAKKKKEDIAHANFVARLKSAVKEPETAAVATVEELPPTPKEIVSSSDLENKSTYVDHAEIETKKPNYKKEVLASTPKAKEKTRGVAAPQPQSAVEPKSAKPAEPTAKLLRRDVFDICDRILSPHRKSEKVLREEIFKLFGFLGFQVNEKRGKGSHSMIIGHIEIETDEGTIGAIPEFHENDSDNEQEVNPINVKNNNNLAAQSLTIPQHNDGIKDYIRNRCAELLERLGYTVETIKIDRTHEAKKKATSPAKAKKPKSKAKARDRV